MIPPVFCRRAVSICLFLVVFSANAELLAQVQELSERCWAVLEHAIREGHPGEQENAVLAVGRLRTDRASSLLREVVDDPRAPARGSALALLGSLPGGMDPSKFDQYVAAEQINVRIRALELLGSIGDDAALNVIQSVLVLDELILREVAFAVLAKVGSPALPVLAQQSRSPSELNRQRAVWAMRRIADPAAIPVLARALEDQSETVRFAAAKALASFGDTRGEAELYAALEGDTQTAFVEAAVSLLVLNLPIETTQLQATLYSPDTAIRAFAVRQLMGTRDLLRSPVLAQALRDASRDPAPVVRRAALEVVGEIADEGMLSFLRESLHDDDPWVRLLGAKGLLRIGQPLPAITDALVPVLANNDVVLRERATSVLGENGDPRALPSLRERFGDPAPGVRRTAVEAIVAMNDEASIVNVERLLAVDRAPDVISESLAALLALGVDVSALEPYLQEDNTYLQIHSAAAILELLPSGDQ